MSVSKKIITYLEKNKYRYKLVEHKTTYTAWDTAQTEKIKPQEVAKTLVMRADREYFLAIVPGNRNLDKKKLLKIINLKRKKDGEKVTKLLEFSKEAWMKKNLPGRVGAVSPLGNFLGMIVYIDSLLLKNKKIYLGSGEYTTSILIDVGQYLKIENPTKGSFSKKK